ncbi:MAG: hypothetical protein A2V67_00475 [Deltaproteobacteria bacterium RBG_13_61_14]|nr:MAG: hypothetical protein A2V67_00475 [Deltaproteobacteria bacterium RBG_13_61_14]
MKDFKDKVALVTGAASGIGRALALNLAREGAHLVLTDVNAAGLQEVQEIIAGMNRRALLVKTDVSKPEEVRSLCQRAIQEMGGVDILCNVAGIGICAEIKDMDLNLWDRILGVNLYGPIYTIHFLLNHMIARRSGHIVNVASGDGLIALPTLGAYSATKFALVGLTETLRAETARFGIGVTAVCPGPVDTNIFNVAVYKNYDPQAPLNFILKHFSWTPERVARAIVKGIKRNRPLLDLSAMTWLGYRIKRFSPGLIYYAQRRIIDVMSRYSTP